MKSIIISDLHHRISWIDTFLTSKEAQGADEVIYMGDYFDQFNDNEAIAYKTAEWLVDRLRNPRIPKEIFITGNHDMAYRFPNSRYAACSGFTKYKSDAINSVMTTKDWDKLIFAYFTHGYLISHAGAHPDVFGEDMTPQRIIAVCNNRLADLNIDSNQWFSEFSAGAARSRGAISGVGGITWLDFKREFEPFDGINQLVGHTPHDIPTSVIGKNSINWCLDTHNRDVYILENDNLKMIENKWLPKQKKYF